MGNNRSMLHQSPFCITALCTLNMQARVKEQVPTKLSHGKYILNYYYTLYYYCYTQISHNMLIELFLPPACRTELNTRHATHWPIQSSRGTRLLHCSSFSHPYSLQYLHLCWLLLLPVVSVINCGTNSFTSF